MTPLHQSPTMAAALNQAFGDDPMAITVCATPGCDDPPVERTDLCPTCLTGAPDVTVEVIP